MSQAGVASVHGIKPPVTIFGYVNVDSTNSPAGTYIVQSTDYYISVDTASFIARAQQIFIIFPSSTALYRLLIVKDRTGASSGIPILLTSTANIDGRLSNTISSNYGAVQILWNGTSYEVF